MNAMQRLAVHPWMEPLGMTLLHFLWEGALIVAIYAVARRWSALSLSPNGRYYLACAALTAMTLAPAVTWMLLRTPSAESVAVTFAMPLSAVRIEPGLSTLLTLPSDGAHTAPVPLLFWVVIFWLAGASLLLLRLLCVWIVVERLRSGMVRPASVEWQRILDQLKPRIFLSRPVRLLVSGRVNAPATMGWLQPVVLVPLGAFAGMSATQMEALLLHELAHIRRHDYLVHILQSAIEAVFFYHPAVWWISGHMSTERELCCDDIAVSVTGDAVGYARALAEFDAARWIRPAVMAANGGSLADRIARLLGHAPTSRRPQCGPGTAVTLFLLAIGACAVFAQSDPRPQFEVASVKPSQTRSVANVRPLPGRLTADASLQILIQYAYGVQPFQVVDSAKWLRSDRYAIDAKADGNTSRNQMFLMLQSLLEDRFGLKVHRETRNMPVYALVTAKGGLRLSPPRGSNCVDSAVEASPEWAGGRMAAPGEAPLGPPLCGSIGLTLGTMQGGKVAMPELVRKLSLVLGRSVFDKTGFEGLFDLQVNFIPDESTPTMPPPPPGSDVSGISLPQALREQLGLQLESAKGPVEVIVVDHAERPSGN